MTVKGGVDVPRKLEDVDRTAKDAERWRELLRQIMVFPTTCHVQVVEFGAPIRYSPEGVTAFVDAAIADASAQAAAMGR